MCAFMQKIELGELEKRLESSRGRLLSAITLLSVEAREQKRVIGVYSVHEWLNYLADWEEEVGFGLREIQRHKKPTQLLRAIDKQQQLLSSSAAESTTMQWEDMLIKIEDARIHIEGRLPSFNKKDLNELKRHRWLGNKQLWPFLSMITVEHEMKYVPIIEAYAKRVINKKSAE